MREIESVSEFYEIIQSEKLVIVEIGSSTCSPCMAIREKISKWLQVHKEIKGIYISIENHPETGGELNVFSAPTVILYADGKESIRESGYFSVEEFFRKTERYENLLK